MERRLKIYSFAFYFFGGDKTITIIGEKPGVSITNMQIKCEVVSVDNDGEFLKLLKLKKEDTAATMVTATFEDNQKTKIMLSAPELAPTETNKDIELQFSVLSDDTPPEILLVFNEKWNIKNNSNTNLDEVLKGLAVFACDVDSTGADRTGDDHKGETTGDEDKLREVDFVQELLNQVVPRKRSVKDADKYDLLDENGYFGNSVARAIELFKKHFNVDNTSDEKSDFQKLVKDYNLTESEWINKIIDKKILVGKDKRIIIDPKDNLINGVSGNDRNDTGLYELYENVVEVFVKKMIEEAEKYANSNNKTWYARTGEKQGPDVEGGAGVSYCFGGKQDIGNYNSTVTSCVTPGGSTLTGFTIYTQDTNGNVTSSTISLVNPGTPSNAAVDNTYKGNINDTGCTYTETLNYPGLYASEHRSLYYGDGAHYRDYNEATDELSNPWPTNAFPQFNMDPANPYWSGIDCSGLVQWAVKNGKAVAPGLNITIPSPPTWQSSQDLFTDNNYNNVLYLANPSDPDESTKVQKKLKKGDLVRYSGHISIVYSDRWGESTFNTDYDIIHAFGWDEYNDEFSRKVIITGNDITAPTGFGRIKLWN